MKQGIIPVPTWLLSDTQLQELLESTFDVMETSDDGDTDGRMKDCIEAVEEELKKRGKVVTLK